MNIFKQYYPIVLSAFLALLPVALTAQNGCFEIDWSYNYGGSARDWGNDLEITNDGGYIMAGYTRSDDFDVSSNNGDWDFWIIKLNNEGQLQWEKNYGGSLNDEATSVQQATDGGYIVAGSTSSDNGDISFNNGDEDFWIIKLNASGNLEWEKTYGGTNVDRAESIKQTPDGGYIVAGFSASQNGDVDDNYGNFDYWVLKISSTGVIEWEKNYGGSGPDWAYEIELADDGGYVVAGSSISDDIDIIDNHGFYDYWILKIDATGAIEWQKNYGGAGEDRAYDIHKTNDGGYVVGGSTYSTNIDVTGNFGGSDYWVLKLDSDGELLWQNNYGGSGSEWAWSIDLTDDNGFVVCGRSNSSDGMVNDGKGNRDFWVVKINSSGGVEWTNSFGGTSIDVAYAVHQTDDDGYIIAGYSESDDVDVIDNYGDWDYWVVKIAPRNIFVELGNDSTLCNGETLRLSDPQPEASYLWQDGSTDSTFLVESEGLYWMELSLDDCLIRDSILITYVGTELADLGSDTSFCFYEPYLLNAAIPNTDSYLWQDGSTDSTFLVNLSGRYSVAVEVDGCTSRDSVTITFNNPIVDLGRDTFICDEYLSLRGTRYDNANYLWQDGSTNRWFTVPDTGTYWVIVDVNGCATADTIQVGKCERFQDPCFVIPNVFSNNGDALNDYFKPVNFCPLDTYQLRIFNRWGQVVFETKDTESAWDGFYKGQRVQNGVYAYFIEYSYTSEGKSINNVEKGTVLMLR